MWDMEVEYAVWSSQEKHTINRWKPSKARYPIRKEEDGMFNNQNIWLLDLEKHRGYKNMVH